MLWHMKNGIGAEHAVFHDGGQSRGHNDTREHGLIEIADQLLQRKRDSGDRRVKGCRDARRHAH